MLFLVSGYIIDVHTGTSHPLPSYDPVQFVHGRMPDIAISAAHFIGIFVGAIAFGIHIITFAYCTRTLTTTRSGWKNRCDIRWLMLAVSLALFIIAMFDIILDFYQSLTILVINKRTRVFEEAEFLRISGWMNVTKVRPFSWQEFRFCGLKFFNIRWPSCFSNQLLEMHSW